tara:strand:+ start:1517 stop:2296 length:780 start_codon:yes stop_codon:yes gene_type:complete
MDFTLKNYSLLLKTIMNSAYSVQTFYDFIQNPKEKTIVLRHDVDLLPGNSLSFAKLQNELGIRGSYYFRAVPESWDENIIKEIANLGHEVGYHYETMDTAKGNVDLAWDQFRYHLDALRKLVDVKTICMHGSPRSPFDNKDIWKKYDYRSLGIIGEPYYDVDFDKVLYLTDTGRRWDGWKTSVRDKVPQQADWIKQGLVFHTTDAIISALNTSKLTDKIMFTMHPQRWNDGGLPWLKEFVAQGIKNEIKKVLIARSNGV